MTALAPADAIMFWQSRCGTTDQFLLYCFAAVEDQSDPIPELAARAGRIADLKLRVAPVAADLAYPRWTPAPVAAAQWSRHEEPQTYDDVLAGLARLMAAPLDAARSCWRLHLFGPVTGAPVGDGPVRVAVLQISHALADGRRASALARALFGGGRPPEPAGIPALLPARLAPVTGMLTAGPRLAAGLALGLAAWHGERRVPAAPPIAAAPSAGPDSGRRVLATITVDAGVLRRGGAPVTAGALAVLAEVLTAYRQAASVSVELTLGRDPDPHARNNFHTIGVDLHAEIVDRVERARVIAATITAARCRDQEPAAALARRAASVSPAPLTALGVRLAAAAPPPPTVTGDALVSSVNRGAADLELAGGRVLFTAGFPALSDAHPLTVGVHGIGETVTISVACDPVRFAAADQLIALLREALSA